MRISDWSSDVCSSDLVDDAARIIHEAACGELSELPGKRARTAPFRELVSTNLIATLRDDRIDIDVAGGPPVEQYLDVGRNVVDIIPQLGGIGGEPQDTEASIARTEHDSDTRAEHGVGMEDTKM